VLVALPNAPRWSCAAPLEGELESLLEHSCTLAHKWNSAKAGRRQLQPLLRRQRGPVLSAGATFDHATAVGRE